METSYATAPDGTRIAYDKSGTGPLLILLHCLPGTRDYWHQDGYVEQLSASFTVAAIDLRGFGASDTPTQAEAFAEDRILGDVCAVADACGEERFLVWGHSYGATISRQLAATSDRVIRAVMAGGVFGPVYTQEKVDPIMAELQPLAEAQAAGTLDQLVINMSPQEREEAATYPFGMVIATLQSLIHWRQIQPDQIRSPLLIYTGTNDHVVEKLEAQRTAIEAAGKQFVIFDGLDHGQLVDAREIVLPVVLPFLLGQS